jgi:hypothetical protein
MRNEKTNPIFESLKGKTTAELIEMAKALLVSQDSGATIAWACVLTVLEETLTADEYNKVLNQIIG